LFALDAVRMVWGFFSWLFLLRLSTVIADGMRGRAFWGGGLGVLNSPRICLACPPALLFHHYNISFFLRPKYICAKAVRVQIKDLRMCTCYFYRVINHFSLCRPLFWKKLCGFARGFMSSCG